MKAKLILLGFLLFLLLPLPGCGKATIAPVAGVVTCNGKPVGQAQLTFSPVPSNDDDTRPGKPATGFTDADGKYVLSTFVPLDGAQVGKHRVLVSLDDTNPARCKRTKQLSLDVQPGSNVLNIEMK